MNTIDTSTKEFTSGIKRSTIIYLRRIIRENPFQTYESWKNSKRKDKPNFITFSHARENPEIVKNFFGDRFVVLSATITKEGFVFPMGILERSYLDGTKKGTKKYILTNELARLLQGNRLYPSRVLGSLPFGDQTLRALQKELGFNTYSDRNYWLTQHVEEILTSTAVGFCAKYSDIKIKKNVIADIKTYAKHIFLAPNNNPILIELLLENWKTPSDATRKKLDKLLTATKSKKMRRTFAILKEAKLI